MTSGDGAFLWPKGCNSIEEIPQDLASAIAHATFIVHLQKQMHSDEMPPQWMWPFSDELEEWFEAVEEKRKAGTQPGAQDETVPMMQNSLTKGRFGR